MNTNSVKSVADSSKQEQDKNYNNRKNKASKERQSRKNTYRKKFNRPHMILPVEDFKLLRDEHNSVKTLFMECWMSDAYGSHWMELNHSLTYKSFMRSKKVLEEKKLFLFKFEKSTVDGKKITCWKVFNLHGARRTDFWLNLEGNSNGHTSDLNGHTNDLNGHTNDLNGHGCPTDNTETTANRQSQNPSVGSQERLSNSPKELLKTLATDLKGDESDRDTAFEERVTSASPNEEKTEAIRTNPTEVQPDLVNQSNSDSKQVAQSAGKEAPGVLNNESTQELLNKPYEFDWRTTEASERCKAQNLAFEAEKQTETYQTSFRDGAARIKAKLAQSSKKDKIKRFGYERNAMSFSDRQALEEYKRELEF